MSTDETLTPEQRKHKERFIEKRGFWSNGMSEMLQLDPAFIGDYADYAAHPGEVLDAKTKEFIHVAIDAVTTHLHDVGTKGHMGNAFEAGATVEELTDVLELTTVAGLYPSLQAGARLVKEVDGPPEGSNDARVDEVKAEFEATFGYWPLEWDDMVAEDPAHFRYLLTLLQHSWEDGALDPKTRELVSLAATITSTQVYSPGARVHLRGALHHGATRAEVMAAIQTASVVGIHTATESATLLIEEAQDRGLLSEQYTPRDPHQPRVEQG